MLKLYAEANKLSDNELTEESIKQLRRNILLSLPATPLFGLAVLGGKSLFITISLFVLCFVSATFLFAVMTHRVTNRFWARDQYLDEWELKQKHHSMAVGFQVLSYIIAGAMISTGTIALFTDIEFNIGLRQVAIGFYGLLVFVIYVPLTFLLWTIKPTPKSKSLGREEGVLVEGQDETYKKFWSIILVPSIILGFIAGIYFSLNAG